jgi:hypothetical protein
MKRNILSRILGLAGPLAGLLAVAATSSAPLMGQAAFTGNWAPLYHEDYPERVPGPELGDYMGIPITAAARLAADSYDADRISVVSEYQCRPHAGDYMMRGLANMRVDEVLDPSTNQAMAIHLRMNFQEMERTIWLDGRPHPGPNAPHTFSGFTTATWDGNMLNGYTTHLKMNYLRRNGLPRSDKASFTEHWVRHGDYLTVTTHIVDPVYLEEPLVRSQTWILDNNQRLGRDICEYVPEVPKPGVVPAHLPGTNPFLHEVADWYGLPYEATRGGAQSMYPEFRKGMGKPDKVPEKCERYCTCGANGGGCNLFPPRPAR